MNTSSEPNGLTIRRFASEFPLDTPRYWVDGDPVVTHILDTFTILIPSNEAFYIRTLRGVAPRVADPALRQAIDDFVRQEAQHGVGHRRHWPVLDAHGYRFRLFERFVDRVIFRAIDRCTPLAFRTAMVACVEHVNAYIGHEFLSQRILADAEPRMKGLFEWHFAEEIEHRHVAYDVLTALNPSWLLRLAGAAFVLPAFYGLITFGTLMLLVQDKQWWRPRTMRLWWQHLFSRHGMVRKTLRHIADYLRPGFHPRQMGNDALAADILAQHAPQLMPVQLPPSRQQAA